MPKHKETIYDTPGLYRDIGFVLTRMRVFEVFLPEKAWDNFCDEFSEVEGRLPLKNEPHVYVHPNTSKYWLEYRIVFRASAKEEAMLFWGYQWVVSGGRDSYWHINKNSICRKLRTLGFRLGTEQNLDYIEARIPSQFRDSFLAGIIKAER